jgi:hypothetical protein
MSRASNYRTEAGDIRTERSPVRRPFRLFTPLYSFRCLQSARKRSHWAAQLRISKGCPASIARYLSQKA